jgi:hypothetical protein
MLALDETLRLCEEIWHYWAKGNPQSAAFGWDHCILKRCSGPDELMKPGCG